MAIFKKMWAVTQINFRRWKADHRMWLIFIFTALFLFYNLRGLTEYGMDSGKNCTGYLLPFLFHGFSLSIGVVKMLLYIGMMLILCDAPFIYQMTPYMVVRSRRGYWWKGECLYIFLATFTYMMFITVCSMLIILPVITFGDSWGEAAEAFAKGTKEMSQVDLANTYKCYLGISTKTMSYLYPIGAQLYTFFTGWASMFVMGLLQYLVSLVSRSMALGTFSAAVFIFIDPAFVSWSTEGRFSWLIRLSPISWSSLNHLELFSQRRGVSIPYVVIAYAVLIVVLLAGIWWASRKVMIEVRGEV